MRKKISVFLLSVPFILVATGTVEAGVYKSTDEEGNVVYTDQPPPEGATEVHVPPPTTYKPPAIHKAQPVTSPRPKPKASQGYESISITSPENEATIRDAAGKLVLTVSTVPALQSGHKIRILMDSEQKAEEASTTFHFDNLDRGGHTFQAFVIDAKGRAIDLSNPITVYVHRPSALFRPRGSAK
jgi:hypothetical protein